jgi:hypothetical protein
VSATLVVDGARFDFDDAGRVSATARIPMERPVFRASGFDGPRERWRVDGETRLRRGALGATIRDDAVLVLRATAPTRVRVESAIRPEYDEEKSGRRLVLDDAGGFGVYPSRPGGGPTDYRLRAGDELWLAVFPARRPNPNRLAQQIAHEGRPRPFPDATYPSTDVIEDAARRCHVFALHAYFWKSGPRRLDLRAGRYALRRRPWTTARHVPSHPDLFARVQDDVRRAGMKLVVYLSPKHSTTPDVFDEMRRVLDDHGVDGLYLDGLGGDFRANDAVVRRTREILGPDRILYLNASDEPFGTPRVFCPFTDAQADFVLRGDAGRGGLALDPFLRFAVSGRNVSNAVGVWCHYGSAGRPVVVERAPSAAHVDAALRCGARLWRRSVWGADALAEFDARYYGASTKSYSRKSATAR